MRPDSTLLADDESADLVDVRADVCFLVTMLEIGVVSSFVKLPAMKPMPSSSRTGSTTAASEPPTLLAATLRCLRKLYTRKKRNESAIVLPVSCINPV